MALRIVRGTLIACSVVAMFACRERASVSEPESIVGPRMDMECDPT